MEPLRHIRILDRTKVTIFAKWKLKIEKQRLNSSGSSQCPRAGYPEAETQVQTMTRES